MIFFCFLFAACFISFGTIFLIEVTNNHFRDSMGHLKHVQEYYRTNGSPMDVTGQYILDEADYPNGFHKIFYYLKISIPWLEKFGGLIPFLTLCYCCLQY